MKISAIFSNFINSIKNEILVDQDSQGFDYYRSKILYSIIFVMSSLILFIYLPSTFLAIIEKIWLIVIINTVVLLWFVFLVIKKNLSYKVRCINILFVFFILGTFFLLLLGSDGAGYLWLFMFPVFTAILLEKKYAFYALAINMIVVTFITVSFSFGYLHWLKQYQSIISMIVIGINYMFLNIFVTIVLTVLMDGLKETLKKEEKLVLKLENEQALLEKRVKERTNQLASANRRLAKLASMDNLTSLYNRVEIEKRIREEIMRVKRYKNLPLCFSILFIDLNNFKLYNDRFGHKAGDIVLKNFAKLLKNTTRDIDMVSRYGGDEFLLLLPHTNKSQAGVLVNRIKNELSQKYGFIKELKKEIKENLSLENKEYIGFSFGIVTNDSKKEIDYSTLINKADDIMYRMKKNKK